MRLRGYAAGCLDVICRRLLQRIATQASIAQLQMVQEEALIDPAAVGES